MKHFTHALKIMCLAFALGSTSASAQTTIEAELMDSTYSHCAPINSFFTIHGTTTGYSPADPLSVHIYYGDGTDHTLTVMVGSWGPGDFYTWFNHPYTLPGTYPMTVIVTGPDMNADTINYTFNTYTCGNITGAAYLDNNSNCTFDAGDDTLRYSQVIITGPTGTINTYAGYDGVYNANVPVGAGYTVAFSSTFTPTCPASGSYAFTSTAGTQVFNFGMECSPGFDLTAYASSAPFVPGQPRTIHLQAGNYSCTDMPATLSITLDPLLTYNSAYPAPTSVTGSTISWDFTAESFLTSLWWYWGSFHPWINVTTSPSATLGDSLCISVTVTPTSGDVNTANNTYSVCAPVVSSYDPNMKEVSPKGSGPEGYVAANTYFDYTVHFQNTGTYQAFNINVVDTMDTDLDMSTFEIMAVSHAMTPYIVGNIVKFDFPDINLPDSTSNEPESHGWIKYRIQMKPSLAPGTEVENTAHIFFDYNPAVVTNTTLNTVQLITAVNTPVAENKNILVYPNPSGTYVNIKAAGAAGKTAYVYDMTGKAITQISLTGDETRVDISSLTNGLYEIRVAGSNTHTARFQKIN